MILTTPSSEKQKEISYFLHIDGLRAIAIIPVFLYHLCSTLCPGGYVGVDIFFVISGYLITGGILKKLRQNQFSIVDFYHRRVKRIIPAYSVFVFCVLIAGIFLYGSGKLAILGETALYSSFFSTNMYFLFHCGYFTPDAHENPLLNLWSLGVEEQFYIFLPLTLLLFWKIRKSSLVYILWTGCILSFLLAVYSTYEYPRLAISPPAAFYFLPQRSWELLAGALLAISSSRSPKQIGKVGTISISLVGWICIIFPYFIYSNETRFPGIAALPPVLGTVLLIKFGENFFSGKILKNKFFVGVGKISYSLYLWHWPIMVFWTYCTFSSNTTLDYIGITIVSFGIAYLSWRFVENPVRRNKTLTPQVTIGITLIICLCIGGISYFLIKTNGLENYINVKINKKYPEKKYWQGELYVTEKNSESSSKIAKNMVKLGESSEPATFILWGDSHALALAPGFDKFAKEKKVSGIFCDRLVHLLSGVDSYVKGAPFRMSDDMDEVMNWIINNKEIKTVFLMGRWSSYCLGAGSGPYESGEPLKLLLLAKGRNAENLQENIHFFEQGLRETCKKLKAANKTVVLFTPLPEHGYSSSEFYARLEILHLKETEKRTNKLSLSLYNERHKKVMEILSRIKNDNLAILIESSKPFLNGSYYTDRDGDTILYLDDDHISKEGAIHMVDCIEEELNSYLK